MKLLNQKTIEKLVMIINADNEPDYRSGPTLCEFFNELGYDDDYWKIARDNGFPSRWEYTKNKLQGINGTPIMEKCIKNVFAVNNYIGRIQFLDKLIDDFNQYLAFDKLKIVRDNDMISFETLDKVIVQEQNPTVDTKREMQTLAETQSIDISTLGLDVQLNRVITERINEIEKCLNNEIPLAAIFLIGSTMEGLFLSMANKYPKQFNQAVSAPKDKDGKIKSFAEWSLNNYINVSSEIGMIKKDMQDFSHVVRNYRNYIHPYSQMNSKFTPDKQTVLVCFQVLKSVICQIEDFMNNEQSNV